MYSNAIYLKSGQIIRFQTAVPFSVDKIGDGWSIVTDEANGQIYSLLGTEIAAIHSRAVVKDAETGKTEKSTPKKKNGSKARFSVSKGEA